MISSMYISFPNKLLAITTRAYKTISISSQRFKYHINIYTNQNGRTEASTQGLNIWNRSHILVVAGCNSHLIVAETHNHNPAGSNLGAAAVLDHILDHSDYHVSTGPAAVLSVVAQNLPR